MNQQPAQHVNSPSSNHATIYDLFSIVGGLTHYQKPLLLITQRHRHSLFVEYHTPSVFVANPGE